ncbi:TRAP transporter small permease [Silicimonas sp. MF1-12-2]|uniref:TRAP transporter small permease n=1 Tax=Silicimonas sp. MF1-12-2 TaxID=3384793 RepID=UPI0039B50A84
MRKWADRLIGLSTTIGALGLLVEVVVILVDVIGRAMGKPLYGSQDLITMTMVILVFGAMALCDRNGGHIAVDIFERYYPAALNRLIDIVSALVGAIIFFGLAWAVSSVVMLNMRFGISSKTNLLGLPIDWFRWALVALAVMTALGMLLRALELAVSGRDIRKEPA